MTCDVLNIHLTNPGLYKKTISVFNFDTTNSSFNTVSRYGLLYNWNTASNPLIAPAGWHVPTPAECQDLINYLGGTAPAGQKLRDADLQYWVGSPTVSTNESKFSARGTGQRHGGSLFDFQTIINNIWTTVSINPILAYVLNNNSITGGAAINATNKSYGNSIRFIKDTSDWTNGETVTDVNGNIYATIKIGSQVWLAEYWRCTKLNDGTDIPNITDATEWDTNPSLAYCAYDNDLANVTDTIEYVTTSGSNPNLNVDNNYLISSVQARPLVINHIIFKCDNPAQSLNPIKEVMRTMWGDSIERLINFKQYTRPDYYDNNIIDFYLDPPMVISADEFMQMDMEALTDVDLILEYCQFDIADLNNNNSKIIIDSNIDNDINDKLKEQVAIIENKPKEAKITDFWNLLILAAISYSVYKLYLNFVK